MAYMASEYSISIFKKMAAVSAELSKVAKDLSVGAKGSSYKAVSEGAVLSAVKPLEDKYGIYSYPISREIVQSEIVRATDREGRERLTFFERIKTVYRFVSIDDGSYIDVMSFGDGMDSGDKSVGKAMTYSDKYALMKAYKIETGDDPDREASQELYAPQNKPLKDDRPKEQKDQAPKLSSEDPATDKQKNYLKNLLKRKGLDENYTMLSRGKKLDDLTVHECGEMISTVEGLPPKGRVKEVQPDYEDDLPF